MRYVELKGIKEKIIYRIKKILIRSLYYYYKIFKPKFIFQKRKYKYFCHDYNITWRNERSVEIPIFYKILEENRGKEILEIGNVLPHYFKCNHDVLDKYEKWEGVINEDVVNFKPKKKYDLIISISTLEHVGFDEKPKEKSKIIKSLNNLKNCLSKNGRLVVTLPLGYNPEVDSLVNKKEYFIKQYYLKQISMINLWKEVNLKEAMNIKYNFKSNRANALFIGVI